MEIRFVGQPFDQNANLIDFIEHATVDGFTEIKIAVAWAKKSGLGRVWDALATFREQGGQILLVLGVSEGGATREGLELALGLADHCYVFHDPRRTFHPKVYFANSEGKRSLLVGSSNLTAGGLGWNYESSLWVDWGEGEGEDVSDAVSSWFERLVATSDSCRPLTAELIAQMEASSDIVIGSESRARRVQKSKADTPEDSDSLVTATLSGLFKPVLTGLRKLPGLTENIAALTGPSTAPVIKSGPIPSGSPNSPQPLSNSSQLSDVAISRRWFKQLDNTAAQQVKSDNSNPTGNLRLSQEDAPVDHKVYFRYDFFGGLPWTPADGKDSEQEVIVRFQTWIDGQDHGMQDLRISHDPRRIAGQGNVPTVLHWGPIGKILRETNYVGYFINLERTESGNFFLIISPAPRGGYQP